MHACVSICLDMSVCVLLCMFLCMGVPWAVCPRAVGVRAHAFVSPQRCPLVSTIGTTQLCVLCPTLPPASGDSPVILVEMGITIISETHFAPGIQEHTMACGTYDHALCRCDTDDLAQSPERRPLVVDPSHQPHVQPLLSGGAGGKPSLGAQPPSLTVES